MRTLGAPLTAEVEKVATDPVILVAMGFTTPVYYSTRETISYDSKSWLAADMKVSLTEAPRLQIFNAALSFGALVLSEGTAGKSLSIYQYYNGNVVLLFVGEMGEATITDMIDISCRPTPPSRTPRLYNIPPTFNHVPAAGTKIKTATQIIILE